jgi:hypothetical protein
MWWFDSMVQKRGPVAGQQENWRCFTKQRLGWNCLHFEPELVASPSPWGSQVIQNRNSKPWMGHLRMGQSSTSPAILNMLNIEVDIFFNLNSLHFFLNCKVTVRSGVTGWQDPSPYGYQDFSKLRYLDLNTAQDEQESRKHKLKCLRILGFSQDMGNSSLCQEGGGSYLDLPTSLPGTVTDKGSEAQERAWFRVSGWIGGWRFGYWSKPWHLMNPKIAGKWMFIPLKMVLIGIGPYPFRDWTSLKSF